MRLAASTREFWRLSRPRGATDRRRARLVTGAVTGCTVVILAAIALLSHREPQFVVPQVGAVYVMDRSLAPFLRDPSARPGWAMGWALLAIPFALFAWQALRTGTAARERRLAALSLAGAGPGQLRRLAALEGARAAVLGAVLAGPVYLVLWIALGRLLPFGSRVLPSPGAVLVAGWVALVVLLGAGGALAAGVTTRAATVTPLGVARRAPRPLGSRAVLLAVIALGAWVFQWSGASGALVFRVNETLSLALVWGVFLLLIVTATPLIVRGTAHLAAHGRRFHTTLAARRVMADPRAGARAAAVLLAAGLTIGVTTTVVITDLVASLTDEQTSPSPSAAVAGVGLAAVCAAAIAFSSLLVSTREQVLNDRRGTAVLAAFGASPRVMTGVIRRQLVLVAIPPITIGALLGWQLVVGVDIVWRDRTAETGGALVALAGAVVLTAAIGAGGAVVAAAGVRSALAEAAVPENLRAP